MLPKLPDQYLFQTSRSGRGEVDRTKNIIIKYCPAKANENLLNAALFDIYACEAGLESHCKVEDYIFVPAILNLERRMRENEK